jgi:NAD dependent epimerase/dehydratase family enzyme
MKHKKIIIAGGTGFIGQGIIKYFGRDNEMVVLTRQSGNAHKKLVFRKIDFRKRRL